MSSISRRQALATLGAAGLAAACQPTASSGTSSPSPPSPLRKESSSAMPAAAPSVSRMPTLYVPHGGGPWPWMERSMFGPGAMDKLRRYLTGLNAPLPATPTAILLVSAHWEQAIPTVMTAAKPPMLYDYSGFPRETYSIQWPAPGHPELALRVRDMLEAAGIKARQDPTRGFDHGTFVVTKLVYPEADVPTFQLSLKRGLDPSQHLAMGLALAPLRDEGVLILGSGMSYHNLPGFGAAMSGGRRQAAVVDHSKAFDDWLVQSMTTEEPAKRHSLLVEWAKAPSARASHPREEHLLPLMIAAGAASAESVGTAPYRDQLMGGVHVCAIQFG